MSEELPQLKQVIIVRSDVPNDVYMQKCIAKASLMLVTRCFESSKDFIGRYELKDYQKTVMEWIDDCDAEIEIVHSEGADSMEAHEWTAEMMGIPTKPVYHNNELYCIAVGPFDADAIDEFMNV